MTKKMKTDLDPCRVAVIGGGAAGMMAAGRAAECGADVILFEKNRSLGKKLAITGKGRCNVTNNCDRDAFMAALPVNGRFLFSAYHSFTPQDTMDFFESLGVALKTERGNRVFPVSDKAHDIVRALEKYTAPCRTVWEAATDILTENGAVCGVRTAEGIYPCDAVILATGGLSYPLTGSTGDGYRMAKKLGHTVTELRPSLVPMETEEAWCRQLQGLSLRNVSVRLWDGSKCLYEDFGEMMFTHFGITGPVILSMSAHIPDNKPYRITVDLKPALDEAALDARLLRDFEKYRNRDFSNALNDLLPQKLIPVFITLCGIAPDTKVNAITREQRKTVLHLLKSLPMTFARLRPISEAIITRGGVDVRQVSPKTMESKRVGGLYFAGEVLDLDAYTGGFNLQIAFCTARLAAQNAAERITNCHV